MFFYLHVIIINLFYNNTRFCLPENEPIREILAKGQNRNDFRNAIMQLKAKYLPYHLGQIPWNSNQKGKIIKYFNLIFFLLIFCNHTILLIFLIVIMIF